MRNPHAPIHIFNEKGSYIITGATLHKKHVFEKDEELDLLQNLLFQLAEQYGWHLEAWSIFSNHYHFVAYSPEDPSNLRKFVTHFHSYSAILINKLHNNPGRKIWYQFWDTHLTFQNSYLARINYVMNNPVRHKLVEFSKLYPWCSAKWFEENTQKPYFKAVSSIKTDSLKIYDDF